MAWKLRKDRLQAEAATEDTSPTDTAVAPEPKIDTQPPESEPDALPFVMPEPPFHPESEAQSEELASTPPDFEPEMNPFVFVAPEPETHSPETRSWDEQPVFAAPAYASDFAPTTELETKEATPSAEIEEPLFAPFAFEPNSGPLAEAGETEAEEAEAEEAEPPFLMPLPSFTEAEDVPSQRPFAPFAPEEPPPLMPQPPLAAPSFVLLDREEVAPSLVHSGGETEVPRVAPFIVDVPPVAEAATPTAGTLVVRIGNFSANFVLTKEVTVIGRPDSLLQSYPDVEIELDDAVSRRHAEIRGHDRDYVVVDLRSTNGTLLNGERLEPHREYPLAPGDRVHLGDRTEIIFE